MPVTVFYPSYQLGITHWSSTPIWEEWLLVHIFNKHHLTSKISNRVGVIGSMNPNALVISRDTHTTSFLPACRYFVSNAHSQLILTPDGASTSWSQACCAGTFCDWPTHLLPRYLRDDWQKPSPNRDPSATDILLLSDSPRGVGVPADVFGHDIISFSPSNSCSLFPVFNMKCPIPHFGVNSNDWALHSLHNSKPPQNVALLLKSKKYT